MRKFFTGHTGFVGRELIKLGFTPLVCDVTNKNDVDREIKEQRPDILFHLASKSNVDFCQDIKNQKEVENVNVWGTFNIFDALEKHRLPGVFVSSDQVWRGGYFEKHAEDSKQTAPVNFYGLTKLIAEQTVLEMGGKIIRTSYLFNRERLVKNIQFMKAGVQQSYPTFIQRSFLHVDHFCNLLNIYAEKFYKLPSILHLAGNERISWYIFMKETEKRLGISGTIKPRYFEKSGFAPRPWFGGLDTKKSFELGFPKTYYVDGIWKMINES